MYGIKKSLSDFCKTRARVAALAVMAVLSAGAAYAADTDILASKAYVDRMDDGFISDDEKGAASGVATLDAGAHVPTAQLPIATSTAPGAVELGSDTRITQTAATGTAGTAGKVYPVQTNADGQMMVDVPWTDNNTTYAVATATTDGLMDNADKAKLDGVAAGAEVNVQSDWNAASGDAQILNKPDLATVATSGSYNDLENKPTIPAAYTLPAATISVLGGVKVGTFANVNTDISSSVANGPAGRAYILQKGGAAARNAAGDNLQNVGVVVVPWTDTKPNLNGVAPTAGSDVTFYAPAAAGTSGQVLKSNGSGAPTWTDNLAPTAAGTSGQVWKSDGSGQGVWGTDNDTVAPAATTTVAGIVKAGNTAAAAVVPVPNGPCADPNNHCVLSWDGAAVVWANVAY